MPVNRFRADAAHLTSNVDSFWIFFFSFRMALLKVACFESQRLHQMDPENKMCLPVYDCYHLVLQANFAESSVQSALQLRVRQKFVEQVTLLAESKDSMLLIWKADSCYPLGVSALY